MGIIIVGVDPGTTSAIAAISINQEILKVKSKKEYSIREMVKDITETGRPMVIASDRKKAPSTVEKIAARFGAQTFTPKENLNFRNKLSAVKKYEIEYENAHERDAIISAILALNEYKKLVRKIKKTTTNDEERIFTKILEKKARNIRHALEEQ